MNFLKMCLVPLPLIILLAGGCLTDSDDDAPLPPTLDHSASATENLSYPVGGYTTIRVENASGDVVINGVADLETVQIVADKIVTATELSLAQAHVDDIAVNPDLAGETILLASSHPQSTGTYHYKVDYTISVPADWRVRVEQDTGTVSLNALTNDLEVSLVYGVIDLNDVVANCDLDVDSGSITGRLGIPAGGLADLDIVNGGISVSIPVDSSAEFSAAVGTGTVTVGGITWSTPGETTQSYVSGTIGAGDGEFDFDVTNGTIVVGAF